jgi:hypothetical protein
MKRSLRMTLTTIFSLLSLVLTGCGTSPASSTPVVELGYLYADDRDSTPTAFVDYQPGMVISAAYSPAAADNAARPSMYKETISYPSGKTIEVEFFVVRSDADGTEFEAAINGKVTEVPSITEYKENLEAGMKDKMAFTFYPYPGNLQQVQMKFPPMCEEPAQMDRQLSAVPEKDWLQSLDSITVTCPSAEKTYSFAFTYTRQEIGDPTINSFTVKIDQTGEK